jgi:hypothetical protein
MTHHQPRYHRDHRQSRCRQDRGSFHNTTPGDALAAETAERGHLPDRAAESGYSVSRNVEG